MSIRSTLFSLAVLASVTVATPVQSQAAATDPRLYPFLGCWRSDTVGTKAARLGVLTCVVPVAGTPDVDLLNLVDGRIASRRRIEANTRPHVVEGQGCRGQEKTSWSALVRRIYLRAEYVCGTGIAGGSTTLFSFLPTGEWLEVENVRSGGGSIVRVERRRDVGIPNGLPREIAGQIGAQRLAVVTARAEAASPLKPDDVVEALRNTDSTVVRTWLIETGQHFALSGEQMMSLARAEVPSSVLQAVMATPPKYQLGVGVDATGRSVDAYLSTPGWAPLYPYPGYPYYHGYYRYGYPYYYPYRRVVYESNVYVYGVPSYNYYPRYDNYTYNRGGYYPSYSYNSYPSYTYGTYPSYGGGHAGGYGGYSYGGYSGSVGVRPASVNSPAPGPSGRRP